MFRLLKIIKYKIDKKDKAIRNNQYSTNPFRNAFNATYAWAEPDDGKEESSG